MAVNDRPNLSVKDSAIWARVKMIPFGVRISDDKISCTRATSCALYNLEMSGILNWALARMSKNGMKEGTR